MYRIWASWINQVKKSRLQPYPYMGLFLAAIALCSLGVNSCESLPYKSDLGLMAASDADSFEMKLRVNGYWCRDIEGKEGECVYSVREGDDLSFEFHLPPGPGALRIFVPNRSVVNLPFREREKPLEWKLSKVKKSDAGAVGFSAFLDDSSIGALQAILYLNVISADYLPLESPIIKIDSDGTSVDVTTSAYTKYFGLTVGDRRTILEKVNRISFSRKHGERIEVETYSEILRSAYGVAN